MKKILLSLSLISLLLLAAGLDARTEINWYGITGGGGQYTSGIYTLESSIGQPSMGIIDPSPTYVCSGYLCISMAGAQVFLPLIKK